jgi:hypothetical protein
MTRKDYILIADVLRPLKPDGASNLSGLEVWGSIVEGIVAALSKDNERFDLERFCSACGYEG